MPQHEHLVLHADEVHVLVEQLLNLLHGVGFDGGHGEVLEALPRYRRDEVEVVRAVEAVLHVLGGRVNG